MKSFNIWRTRMWPQCYEGQVVAKNIWDALAIAKESGVLNPIVGEV